MFENIMNFFKKLNKKNEKAVTNSRDAAKERLHLVLMQDRANVSADFLELMKQEIIEVIKKYIDVDEAAIDVRLTNKENEDGTNGAPALYANIPILNIKNEARKVDVKEEKEATNKEDKKTEKSGQEESKKNSKEERQKEEVTKVIIDNKEDDKKEKQEESKKEEIDEVVIDNDKQKKENKEAKKQEQQEGKISKK